MRNALMVASAIFSDLGNLCKPKYLYRIVEDALNQERVMKERISGKIVLAGFFLIKKKSMK